MNPPNFRDVEQLSAYLDGQLPPAEAARLETRLKTDPQLRTVFNELNQSRALLRQLPARRAPRNFTLTPKMAGVKPPVPRAFPLFRFASALAALLFFFSLTINSLPAFPTFGAAAPLPAYGIGGAAPMEAPAAAATAAPAMLVPAAPPAAAQEIAPTATSEVARNAAATQAPATDQSQAKLAPTTEAALPLAPAAPVSAPIHAQPLIPASVMYGLLILAVLAGAAALFVRWRAEREFSHRQK